MSYDGSEAGFKQEAVAIPSDADMAVKLEGTDGSYYHINGIATNGLDVKPTMDHTHGLSSKEETHTSVTFHPESPLLEERRPSAENSTSSGLVKDANPLAAPSTPIQQSDDLYSSLQTLPPDLSIPANKSSPPAVTPPTSWTPPKGKPPKRKKEADIGVTQFIHDLPRAEEQALKEFELLPENTFQHKGLGRSNQQVEMMVCDCVFDPVDDDPEDACGPHSNCINRLTQVECLKYECQTREYCQNQRFSKKQYAPVEVVQTEKKGYGLRAGADIAVDEFVYEYIGEVVSQTSFLKRMQQYADEGIQHFYFMMLQKEEYIDATKKGGIARFANHSCNPNCYVAKWVVGKRMRMGIFAKRDIQRGEELTFNYNVDRYGHNAQICYCDEPNCVGTIGGKTQTDLGGMDDLYIDALGIADDVAALGLKGTKKKKGRKLDEDFIPVLKPITELEVPKVVAAIRQCTSSRTMLFKLLERVKMTDEDSVKKQLMRMHGFSLMWTVMTDSPEDTEILRMVLETMAKWKLSIRNKVEDAKIEEPVSMCLQSKEEDIRSMASSLLDYWGGLESVYRIPRKIVVPDAEDDAPDVERREDTPPEERRPRFKSTWEEAPVIDFELAPIQRPSITARSKPPVPNAVTLPPAAPAPAPLFDRARLEAILALAKTNQEAGAAAAAAAASDMRLKGDITSSSARKRDKHRDRDKERARKRPKITDEEHKEKKLQKLVGEVVVKTMSKYKHEMDRETFKRYAKECTTVLVDKEKRGKSYTEGKLDSLSPEKQEKMKKFIKEYAHKILKKLKDKGKLLSQLQRQPGVSTPDTPASASQPRSVDDDAAMVRDMFEPNHEDEDEDVDMEADSSQRADDLAELGQTPDDGSVNASPVDALKMIAEALAADDRKAAFMTPPATEKLSAERTLS